MKNEQISFIEPVEVIEPIKKQKKICRKYDASICNKCLCNKCKYNVDITPFLSKEECRELRENDSCFNCDECYLYGMDNESLSENIKFICDIFKMSNHYVELEAKRRRKGFKIV